MATHGCECKLLAIARIAMESMRAKLWHAQRRRHAGTMPHYDRLFDDAYVMCVGQIAHQGHGIIDHDFSPSIVRYHTATSLHHPVFGMALVIYFIDETLMVFVGTEEAGHRCRRGNTGEACEEEGC